MSASYHYAVIAFASIALVSIPACDESHDTDPFADELVSFSPDPDSSFGHDRLPDVVLGPPGGTLDVASLGCEGEIVLRFDEPIVDREGPDLIVFENGFSASFPEPGEVSVSENGETWWVFECDPVGLLGCAGVNRTQALPDSGLSPTDPSEAGGDAFDLGELDGGPDRVSFVRIRDVSRAYWQAQGLDYCDPGQMGSGGFDLDAIAAVE